MCYSGRFGGHYDTAGERDAADASRATRRSAAAPVTAPTAVATKRTSGYRVFNVVSVQALSVQEAVVAFARALNRHDLSTYDLTNGNGFQMRGRDARLFRKDLGLTPRGQEMLDSKADDNQSDAAAWLVARLNAATGGSYRL